mgnify:CR=1 FL=1
MKFEDVESVVYLEPKSSFCEIAADYFRNKFNLQTYLQGISSIKQIVEYLDETPNTLAVLPAENTIDGMIRETFDSIVEAKNPNIKILSEVILPVNYCLLSKTTELYSITGVIATPQMLAKCHEFIENELPRNLNIVEAPTSYEASRLLDCHNLTFASIGTEKTAETFNLNILKPQINDDKYNFTRFVLVGDYETKVTGFDKTTIAFACENKPGELVKNMNIFAKYGINISYISSQASKYNFDEHTLIVNLDGHYTNPKLLEAINEVKNSTKFFKFLGSYPKSKVQENVLT